MTQKHIFGCEEPLREVMLSVNRWSPADSFSTARTRMTFGWPHIGIEELPNKGI